MSAEQNPEVSSGMEAVLCAWRKKLEEDIDDGLLLGEMTRQANQAAQVERVARDNALAAADAKREADSARQNLEGNQYHGGY